MWRRVFFTTTMRLAPVAPGHVATMWRLAHHYWHYCKCVRPLFLVWYGTWELNVGFLFCLRGSMLRTNLLTRQGRPQRLDAMTVFVYCIGTRQVVAPNPWEDHPRVNDL